MYYKCPDCGKIIEEYSKKCPECGSLISLSDTASENALFNKESTKDFDDKMKLLRKRVKWGYCCLVIFYILLLVGVTAIGLLFDNIGIAMIFALVLIIIFIVINIKFRLFSCPYCDCILHRVDVFYHKYCPHCGSAIKYGNYTTRNNRLL
ncbi:MAG: hypothetical protein IKH42_01990 [Lachnospiraceae bacterium]|nr:hypothetical protein [Lachnospiraceae bacterium]